MDVAIEELQATAAAVNGACDALKAIDALLLDKMGGQAPDFKALLTDLNELRTFLNAQVQGRTGAGEEEGGEGGGESGGEGGRGVPVGKVAIRSRDDVVKLLDLVCRYYEMNEPGSPVPLLLKRAKSMVTMNFLDMINSLAPSGIAEARNIFGITDE